MVDQSIKDKYFGLLKTHIARPEEEQLAEAAGLGRELVLADVPPEEIGEIHEEALKRLAEERPDAQVLDTIRASSPLMEMLMAYGLAFREQLEERKQAEEALRESENRYRLLAENVTDLIWTVDMDFRYGYISPSVERLRGYTVEEAMSQTLDEILTSASFKTAIQVLDEELDIEKKEQKDLSRARTFELEMKRKDGSTVWTETKMSFVRDQNGQPVGILGVTRDITERRWAEEEQIWLVTAIEQAAEAIVITDTDGTIQYVNPAFERITGYSREEAIGQNHRILKSGEHDENFYEELWGTITRGEVWTGHFINRKKDGTLYEEDATISPIRKANGEIVKYVEVKRDVTREVALEAQFHQAQKMEATGRLAGGVAHDFNNILNVILVYSGFMKEELPSGDPWRDDLEEIERAARRAVGLTRSLLAFSRRQVMTPQPLNLNDVARGMGKMLEKMLGEDIELRIKLDEDLGIVSADWGQIEQMIMNLAVNARDAMPRGGKLTIESFNVILDENYADQHKTEDTVLPGPYVMLGVNDTGHGMTEETKEHIFEPFFTTKDVDKGTGLGLATVYGIIKQSNGYIWVYSEPGAGTTFKIYLPKTEEAAEEVIKKEQVVGPLTGDETVLVVEDDEHVRKATARILSNGGYKIIEAGDQIEAEKKFKEAEKIDLLLTDVIMPRGNGHELAQKLTGLKPELKVLYMSGYSGEIMDHHGILIEDIKLIQKPFPAKELLRQVREVLDSK